MYIWGIVEHQKLFLVIVSNDVTFFFCELGVGQIWGEVGGSTAYTTSTPP
jgi:hypothetical protein